MAAAIATLLLKVRDFSILFHKDVYLLVLPVGGGSIGSVARALPLPTEVRLGHWPRISGTVSGSSYVADRSFPATAYVSVGGGDANRAGKQSSLDRRYDKHLRSHDSARTGEGEVMGPLEVAGRGEGNWAGWA